LCSQVYERSKIEEKNLLVALISQQFAQENNIFDDDKLDDINNSTNQNAIKAHILGPIISIRRRTGNMIVYPKPNLNLTPNMI
jgi:hypothetical protein